MKYIFGLLLLAGAVFVLHGMGFFAWMLGIGVVALAGLTAFFAVGTLGFYGLVALCILATWWIEATAWEDDHPAALALIPFAIWCLVVHFVSRLNLVDWVRENWSYAATRIGWYLFIGFLFFVVRWVIHVVRKREELDRHEAQFRNDKGIKGALNEESDEVKFQFTEYLTAQGFNPDADGWVVRS